MPRQGFLLHLLRSAVAGEGGGTDAELLRRFAAVRDEAAFEMLLLRHADAVWKTCRGVLRREADAEDAFQATFLILVRKTPVLRSECVAGWLHRVAVRVALSVRTQAARMPNNTADSLANVPVGGDANLEADITLAIHEEIGRLPERYRLPIVLCDLEGRTHAEAGRILGWPIGSVSGRLSRAKDILRKRLTNRGVGVSPLLAVAAVGSAPSGVVRAATAVAAGLITASPSVSRLVQGVLFAMQAAKLKLIAGVTVGLLGLAGAGTMVAMGQGKPGFVTADPAPSVGKPQPGKDEKPRFPSTEKPPTPPTEKTDDPYSRIRPSKPPANNDKVKELLRQRLEIFRSIESLTRPAVKAGGISTEELIKATRNVLNAELELCDTDEERIVILEKLVELAKTAEGTRQQMFKANRIALSDALPYALDRLQAEIDLERVKARVK